jgi:gluconate 5-dehydrogenase
MFLRSISGLKQLTKAAACDLSTNGVRVNSVGPGYIKTNMTTKSWNDKKLKLDRTNRTILGRWGESNDLIGIVIFLASDASSYITGQEFYVDGGWLAKGL